MSEGRFLRSKRLRAALYAASGGKCSICQCELAKGWHADHVEPWSKTKRTNVFEMQALCPQCNLKKGKREMSNRVALRPHQARMQHICEEIRQGRYDPHVTGNICPGGGKTLLGTVFGSELVGPRFCDLALWLVPRAILRTQTVKAFYQPDTAIGRLCNRYDVNVSTPARDLPFVKDGFRGIVATYDWLESNDLAVLHLADAKRLAVIFDEAHVLGHENVQARVAEKLKAKAVASLRMTGSPFRHNGDPMRLFEENQKWDVEYSMSEAIDNGDLRRYEFVKHNGVVEYGDSERPLEEVQQGLSKVFQLPEFWRPFLGDFLRAFRQDRKVSGWSQSIVVLPLVQGDRTKIDERFVDSIQAFIGQHNLRCVVSVSEDGDKANHALEAFQEGRGDVLVTVGKAYMGFDCPAATHMAFMSHYRSKPHSLQSFARVMRMKDGLPNKCIIHVPSDPNMLELVKWFEDQAPDPWASSTDVESREPNQADGNGSDKNGGGVGPTGFQDGALEYIYPSSDISHNARLVHDFKDRALATGSEQIKTVLGLLSPSDIVQLHEAAANANAAPSVPKPSIASTRPPTDAEKRRLESELHNLVTKYCKSKQHEVRSDGRSWYEAVSADIKRYAGVPSHIKTRKDWSLPQLQSGIEYMRILERNVA